MNNQEIINILQMVIFVIIFTEYIPQIMKTAKKKKVGDISIAHWVFKYLFTLLTIYMLYLTGNTLIVVMSQIFNLVFTTIICVQLVKYRNN